MSQSRVDLTSGPQDVMAWGTCLTQHMLRGLEVVRPAGADTVEAHLATVRSAAGRLWWLRSTTQSVRHRPYSRRFIPVALVQLAGTTLLEQGGRHCRLGPGSFAYLNAADELLLDHLEPFEQLYIAFPDDALPHDTFRRAALVPMSEQTPVDRPFFECTKNVWTASSHLDGAGLRLAFEALLALAKCTSAFRDARDEKQLHPRVQRALSFIDEHLADPALCPQRIATSQRVSRRYLDELFRETGHRMRHWILERRLQHAAERLGAATAPQQSLLQVCLDLGFRSQSHFTRAFTKRFGQGPREYRRSRVAA